jgi:hypothetical protein
MRSNGSSDNPLWSLTQLSFGARTRKERHPIGGQQDAAEKLPFCDGSAASGRRDGLVDRIADLAQSLAPVLEDSADAGAHKSSKGQAFVDRSMA